MSLKLLPPLLGGKKGDPGYEVGISVLFKNYLHISSTFYRIWYEFIHVKEHRKQGSLKSNSDLSVDLPSFTVVY